MPRSSLSLVAAVPESIAPERERHAGWAGRLEAVELFLLLLAKAVRQLHAYPVTSQVCADAVQACLAHLVAIDGPDEIPLAVSPDALLLHEHALGETPFIRHELTRRLRRARVAEVTVHREATTRDLTRFCVNVIRGAESADRNLSVAELMAEDGVEAITVQVTSRRAVLEVGATAPAQRDLVTHERRRREETHDLDTHAVHLFPPHRGWIRLDPAESYDGLTLADLAIMVDEPEALARLLHQLVEDAPAGDNEAFDRRLGDVATLFAGLEPRLSRVMFGKLARAVLALEPERRHRLLKRTVLPAIFDGRPAATLLTAFPDLDLAEALCLLLELETSGPAMAMSALDQLDLEPERRAAILPIMEEIVQAGRDTGPRGGLDKGTEIALEKHARRLTKIDASDRRSFVELAGFDFRIDDSARIGIDTVRTGVHATDGLLVELTCLTNLVRLQPNPEVADAFLNGARARAAQLVEARRWDDLASALEHLASVTASLRERRPEIVSLVEAALGAFATTDFAGALIGRYREEGGAAVVLRVLDAIGPFVAPAMLELLTADAAAGSVAVAVMCERAALFAPALAEGLASAPASVRHHVARVLGHGGEGYEDFVGGMLDARDERTTREALRALSRIGTARAVGYVAAAARDARGWMASATVETLLRFPPQLGGEHVRDLLAQRAFVLAHPEEATRLIARAARTPNIEPVLRSLTSLRFRFWNRALVNVARAAREHVA